MTQFVDAVLDRCPVPIVGLDRDGRVTAWSAAAAGLFGHDHGQALGRRFTDLLTPAAVPVFNQMLAGARAASSPPADEAPPAPPAAPGWTLQPVVAPDGATAGYCLVMSHGLSPVDQNGRSEAGRLLFFEHLPVLSYLVRIATATNPEVLMLSPQFDMAFGYPWAFWTQEREARGAIVHPDDREWRRAALDDLPPEAATLHLTYRLIGADGAVHWVRERANRVTDALSGHTYWIGFFDDISEQKEAEAKVAATLLQLRESNDRLAELNAAKADFVATISHEFRTPLTSIQGFSELLESESLSPAEVLAFARTINQNAARMARMVSSVLDLEALEAGDRQIRRDLLNLAAIMQRVLEALRPMATAHSFMLDLAPDLPATIGDPELIEQVMMNIVANAIKYSPDGGPVAINLIQRAGAIELTVADRGMGVPAEHRERIFSRYGRILRTEQFGIEGTGLGLPIARHILEIHNGRIWVEANEPRGSVFHVVLPIVDGATAAGARPAL